MFPPHDYPGTEGCEATCEGDDKTEESCTSNFFCEWDGERCWSAVGPNPCPVDEAQMHYFWENYGVEPGMFDHPHDMFPPHDYPGTEGCEATCEGDDKTEESCTSNFFCEWDGERDAGPLSGRTRAPPTKRRCTTSGKRSIPTTCSLLTNIPAPMDVRRRARAMTRPRSFAPPTFTASGTASDAGPLSGRSRAPLTKRR